MPIAWTRLTRYKLLVENILHSYKKNWDDLEGQGGVRVVVEQVGGRGRGRAPEIEFLALLTPCYVPELLK